MDVFRFAITPDGLQEFVLGGAAADTIDGGAGSDILTGGGERDTFVFRHGSGSDVVTDFQPGVDLLSFHGISIRTAQLRDTEQGLIVDYGEIGAAGPEHVLLAGVHSLQAGDYQFI